MMSKDRLSATVRQVTPFAKVIDLKGEINSFSEQSLIDAYNEAVQGNFRTLIFNFTQVEYINSLGIGMLVTLLIRARRESKKIYGYGLSDHYRGIFEITRLDQVIPIYSTEEVALAFADPDNLPEREN
jgi:anti-sigma B factor antagonist